MLNEGRDMDEFHRRSHGAGRRYHRVIAAAQAARRAEGAGEPAANLTGRQLFAEFGYRLHVEKQSPSRAFDTVVAASLEALGLPAGLAAAADDAAWDQAIRQEHDAAMALVGDDVGSPVIGLEAVAFFGPVLGEVPHGEDAGRLWDGALALASWPSFYELKRSRTGGLTVE
jgi:2-hydroxychromene-2-carboxylate isomerase